MVLCKVMNNNEDEVSNILSAKLSIKFSGVEIEAMKVLSPDKIKNFKHSLHLIFRQFVPHPKHVTYIN